MESFTVVVIWSMQSDCNNGYVRAMHCIKLHVTNLEFDIATFTWIGMAKRKLVSCLCKLGTIVLHKYSEVKTTIHMRHLNSLALNEPNKLWLKNHGLCNPRSWAYKRRCYLLLHNLNPCSASVRQTIYCQCHSKIASLSPDMHSKVVS